MKQQIQLAIPEPCHENWDKMTATQQGRFCLSCQKEVIDFSVMTDAEILDYISTASSSTCGRAGSDQLNRNLSSPQSRSHLWKYGVGVAASFILITTKSTAQGKIVKHSNVSKHPIPKKRLSPGILGGAISVVVINKSVINGIVTDDKNNPVPFASVRINRSAQGVAADSAGNFRIQTNEHLSEVELQISSVGFNSSVVRVDAIADTQQVLTADGVVKIDIGRVSLTAFQLDEVVVKAARLQRLTGFAGGISFCRKVTVVEKTTAKFKDVLGINEIKAFPNPIAPNTEFQLRYKLKETGDYQLRFTDASGRIIASSQVNIASNNQLESFNAGLLGSSGIYFASISNKKTGKTYTTRLLLQ